MLALGAMLLASGCAMPGSPGLVRGNLIKEPESGVWCRHKFVIPVIKPSLIDRERLMAAARELAGEHRTSNVIYVAGDPPQLSPSADRLDDTRWKRMIQLHLKSTTGPATYPHYEESWAFDPGTTAHVYLRKGWEGGVSYWKEPAWWGAVLFVKDGKCIGSETVSGDRHLDDYYRALEEFGFYIPKVPGTLDG